MSKCLTKHTHSVFIWINYSSSFSECVDAILFAERAVRHQHLDIPLYNVPSPKKNESWRGMRVHTCMIVFFFHNLITFTKIKQGKRKFYDIFIIFWQTRLAFTLMSLKLSSFIRIALLNFYVSKS